MRRLAIAAGLAALLALSVYLLTGEKCRPATPRPVLSTMPGACTP